MVLYKEPVKSATIYDVARHAGVSSQTVSRFLAGFEGIRPETRARVEASLAALNYRPNSAARMLRLNRVNRLGVLAHSLGETGPSRIITGATMEAHRRGYVLDIIGMDGDDRESVDTALALSVEHQVAGILATAQTQVVLEQLRTFETDVPMIIDVAITAAGSDRPVNELAGWLAADHLLELGHRRVGYIGGPATWFAAHARQRGFEDRLRQGGGELVWVREGDWSARSGHAVIGSTTREADVTAVAAGNDSMAIGAISALATSGVQVPHDVSVIGTDDLPESAYVLPSLSTVALDFEGEGRFVTSLLVDQVEGTQSDESALVLRAPIVKARGSTMPALERVR
jgi:DNA-binding LacI/PurR family transcriptional regulator